MWSPASYIAEVVASRISCSDESLGSVEGIRSACTEEDCEKMEWQLNGFQYTVFWRRGTLKLEFFEKMRADLENQSRSVDIEKKSFETSIAEKIELLFGVNVDEYDSCCFNGSLCIESFQLWLLMKYIECHNYSSTCLAISSPSWIVNISSVQWKVSGIRGKDSLTDVVCTLDTEKKYLVTISEESKGKSGKVVLVGSCFHCVCATLLHFQFSHEGGCDMISIVKRIPEIQDVFFAGHKNDESILATSREFRSTQVWNHFSNSIRAIKSENSADTFHHVQGSHNENIFRDVLQLTNRFPHLCMTICVLLSSGDVFLQKVETTHVFSDIKRNKLLFSVAQCTPAYNHVFEKSSSFLVCFLERELHDDIFSKEPHQLVSFTDTIKFQESKFRVPLILSEFLSNFSVIHTEVSFPIGDCSVIVGEIEGANNVLYYISERTVLLEMKKKHLFFPTLCLAIHRNYGLVGVVGTGCILSSHFPPTLSVLLSEEHTPFKENEVEPNVTLFFFRNSSEVFVNKSFFNCLDELPFPVSPLDSNKNNFGCEVKGVILRMDSIDYHILLTLSVSDVSIKSDLLCCILDQ